MSTDLTAQGIFQESMLENAPGTGGTGTGGNVLPRGDHEIKNTIDRHLANRVTTTAHPSHWFTRRREEKGRHFPTRTHHSSAPPFRESLLRAARPTYQAQASVVEPERTMDVPVVVRPQASVVGDVRSVSRPTGTNKDGSSRDGKIPPPKEGVRDTVVRPTTGTGSSGYCSRGGRRGVGLLAFAIVSAINLVNVESKMLLVQLPSGFRCIWYNLPHLVQFVVLLLMVVLLYGLNRAFDKADEAMSTRLSCATTAFLDERRHYHHAAPRRVF